MTHDDDIIEQCPDCWAFGSHPPERPAAPCGFCVARERLGQRPVSANARWSAVNAVIEP